MTNLLPPNSTPNEKAMHAAVMSQMPADRFDEINTYKDPQTCPEYLLPYLAWERGVDEWDTNWPTQTKRDVVESAPEEQAHGGTVYAIKRALASLGFEMTLTEAWQSDGLPHSFQLFASLNNLTGITLDAEAHKLIHRKVRRTKNVRSQYDLQFGIGFNQQISIGAGIQAVSLVQKTARAAQRKIEASTGFVMGAAVRAVQLVQLRFETSSSALQNALTFNGEPLTFNGEPLTFTPSNANALMFSGEAYTFNGEPLTFTAA